MIHNTKDNDNQTKDIPTSYQKKYVKVMFVDDHSGFYIPDVAIQLYSEKTGTAYNKHLAYHVSRHDPILVEILENLDESVFTPTSRKNRRMNIQKIPYEFKDCYAIDEYDGKESIDLSSNLLVGHLLENMNIKDMTREECKTTLLDLQKIMKTNYYDYDCGNDNDHGNDNGNNNDNDIHNEKL